MSRTAQAIDWRALAVSDPLQYAALQWPGYQVGLHHKVIADAMIGIAEGRLKRVALSIPPQHGKTLEASIITPAWLFGRNPGLKMIEATYNQDRANDLGRNVLSLLESPTHRMVFPGCRLKGENGSASRQDFAIENGGLGRDGQFFAVGRGGSTTGRGADILIVDDPIKDRMEADSAAVQRELIDWYSSVLLTRLSKDAAIIVIQTRWSENDLIGYVTANEKDWHVINLPALAEENDPIGRKPGEALWPAHFPREVLEDRRARMLPRDWNALYQGHPEAPEGTMFPREKIHMYDPRMTFPRLHLYLSTDYAVRDPEDVGNSAEFGRQKVHADFTELGVFGLVTEDHGEIKAGTIIGIDGWYGQKTPDRWIEEQIILTSKYDIRLALGEGGVIRHAVEAPLKRRLREERVTCTLRWYPSIHDKIARARGLEMLVHNERLWLPDNAWGRHVRDQLVAFTGDEGAVDDAVDMCSLMVRHYNRMLEEGRKPQARAVLRRNDPFSWSGLTEGPRVEAPTPF